MPTRKRVKLNFIDVFGFMSCPVFIDGDGNEVKIGKNDNPTDYRLIVNKYIFMEKIDKDVLSMDECLFEQLDRFQCNNLKWKVTNVLFVQILHAIATYQKHYKLMHNDLHGGNVFVEFIKEDTVYRGQNLSTAEWFHYKVGKTDLYLPWIPFLAKIGDFGLSVKYSKPIVGDKEVFEDGYDQHDGNGPWIPNWYSPVYDMLFILENFIHYTSENNKFILSMMNYIVGVNCSCINTSTSRPILSKLSTFDKIFSPAKILTNKKLMGGYMKRPSSGKIVTLGSI